MKIDRFINNAWIVLIVTQIICIIYYINSPSAYGIINTDAFSYHVHWSKVGYTLNPFQEPVLHDPGNDLVRIPFSFPHFIMGVTTRFFSPELTYLIWSCVGVLTSYFSLLFFARALGFGKQSAALIAFTHYTFFHILSQLPPLSLKQLNYIWNALTLLPETLQHFGPRQYPHDIFFYPLLYTLLALTLFGIKKVKNSEKISTIHTLIWMVLCLLLPFNYFYHWFQFAFVLAFVLGVGILLKWWRVKLLLRDYRELCWVGFAIVLGWLLVLIFQSHQLQSPDGYRFSLMGGLTEAKFSLLPMGLLLRIMLWSLLLLVLFRLHPYSVLFIGFMLGCIVLMNMQWITGKNIQPGHWSFGIDRIFTWILLLCVSLLIKKIRQESTVRWIKPMLGICILFHIAFSIRSWQTFEEMSRWSKERTDVIAFLKDQSPSVVLAPEIWLETDILIHTPHHGFLPRGAQSAVSLREHWQRLTFAAWLLGYSQEGFVQWIHTRSVRFFGMLYGTEKEFSSTYYYDSEHREGVEQFQKGDLPVWDWNEIESIKNNEDSLHYRKPQWIVLHQEEADPSLDNMVYTNARYKVYQINGAPMKKWGSHLPIREMRYPVH